MLRDDKARELTGILGREKSSHSPPYESAREKGVASIGESKKLWSSSEKQVSVPIKRWRKHQRVS